MCVRVWVRVIDTCIHWNMEKASDKGRPQNPVKEQGYYLKLSFKKVLWLRRLLHVKICLNHLYLTSKQMYTYTRTHERTISKRRIRETNSKFHESLSWRWWWNYTDLSLLTTFADLWSHRSEVGKRRHSCLRVGDKLIYPWKSLGICPPFADYT